MMRKMSVVGLASLLVLVAVEVSAEEPRVEQEVIIRCSSDVIRLPWGQAEAKFEDVEIVSSQLQELLANLQPELISKAYPRFDTSQMLSKVYKIVMKSANDAESLVAQLPNLKDLQRLADVANEKMRRAGPDEMAHMGEELRHDERVRWIWAKKDRFPQIACAERNLAGDYYTPPPVNDLSVHQWYHKSEGMQTISAWDYTTECGKKVAVIDHGIYDHVDLNWSGDNTFSYTHGTQVSGVLGAITNNGLGIAGTVWGPHIYSYNNSNTGLGTAIAIAEAINDNCKLANVSWGYQGDLQVELGHAMAMAHNNDVLIVCSGGNEGVGQPSHPASECKLSVGAVTYYSQHPSFSNRGIDVVAPGGNGDPIDAYDIFTLDIDENGNSTTGWNWGTSFSAPLVAGVAGLVSSYLQDNLGISPTSDDLVGIIVSTVQDLGEDGWDSNFGWGKVKADEALQKIDENGHIRLKHLYASGKDWEEDCGWESVIFIGVPGLPFDTNRVRRYGVYKNVSWHHPCTAEPDVWVNMASTNGFNLAIPNFGERWGRVLDGSVTTNSATLRTYVYKVYNFADDFLGWFPCQPDEVYFSYSVLGEFNLFQPSLSVSLVQNGDSHYFHVAWSDNNEYHQGYTLQSASGGGGWQTVANLPPSCHSYNYTPVWGSQMYYFRVRATWGESHVSEWSNEVGIRNVPNPPTDVHVSLKWVCGWPEQPKIVSTWDDPAGSEGRDLVVPTDISHAGADDSGDRAPEPPPGPPCFPTNLAYVSWDPPENQIDPVDYYMVRLLLYLGGIPNVFPVGPYDAQACTLCLWPNKEYRLSVVAHKYGLHSDETVGTQIFTTGEAIICSDYSHKGPPPQAPEPNNPEITSSLASADRCLIQNRPNPFNPETDICYNLPEDCMVKLVVYNMLGQRVRVLVDEQQTAGIKTVHWDGKDDNGNELASGVYFCRLEAANHVEAKKMILMR